MHTRSVRALELKIPPVALAIITAILMRLGAAFAPGLSFGFPFKSIVAWAFGLFGAITCTLGVVEFRRARTTVNPTKLQSASSLVTLGIYRHTRNPMYLGLLLLLAAWAAWIANIVAFLAVPAFVLYMNQFQIKPEERALTSIFGDQFKAYCSTVRRWI